MKFIATIPLIFSLATFAVSADPEKSSTDQTAPAKKAMSATWPDVEYAELRGYLYFPGGKWIQSWEGREPILKEGKLHPNVVNPEGAKLSPAQAERLLKSVRPCTASVKGDACFLPHHGFVFHDKAGKPVAALSICFLCELGHAHPGEIIASSWEFEELETLITELGLPVFKDIDEAEAYYEKEVKGKANAKPAAK
ncbi:hypothetical protein OJ996_22040 [Luteolibacter sp. GHJ8]|uniref:Uncharacterized protein n=1 Tax=Luteolibacter rhizosphaerae TaxID=2989719 RepID=A0ABT3G8V3_9BACT|nr:hypothetical protein [Luteolibacter rhizosphaerae]MCW1916286.1 hypothetical protein [Luteolibacter rhizosphaerae]